MTQPPENEAPEIDPVLHGAFIAHWNLLRDQMFAYDEGKVRAVLPLAVTIRNLVYDTKYSKSVLTQMGLKHSLGWISSGEVDLDPAVTHQLPSLTSVTMSSGIEASMQWVPHPGEYIIDPEHSRVTTFDDWWTCPVIQDSFKRLYSREDLVKMIANRGGGAHLDIGRMTPEELALMDGSDYGFVFVVDREDGGEDVTPVRLSPAPASVRTIASEIDISLHNQRSMLGLPPEEEEEA